MSINVPVGMGSAADPRVPLTNLTTVRGRLDSLQRFLSESVNTNTVISKNQMEMVSSELSSAIQQTIVNAAALLACSQSVAPPPPMPAELRDPPDRNKEQEKQLSFQLKEEVEGEERHNIDGGGGDVVEVDAVELLAEHVHFCEICGKGFKRDANLRMHMRAHGNQFRTLEALAKPAAAAESGGGVSTKARFSCPFDGCNRNRKHKKFRPLKSVLCVKNHFKRSHCPKLYSCNRCHKKNFSVVADLKSHLKHCGESRWKCSCGTSFSRKDKLFGHMALFEGHMPAVEGEEGEGEAGAEVKGSKSGAAMAVDDDGFFDGLMDGVGGGGGGGGGSMEGCSLQDVLEYPTSSNWVTEMSFFCGFEL